MKLPKPGTIGQTVLFLMLQNQMMCDADILAEVKKEHPNCKTSLDCIWHYRCQYKKYFTFILTSDETRKKRSQARPSLRLVA